jgi:hypothetical protein
MFIKNKPIKMGGKKMKKILVYAFVVSLLIQGLSYSFEININEVRNYLFLDAIETTVKKMEMPNTTNPVATVLVNKATESALKKQLEYQQRQLSEIESSSDFYIVKWFKKKRVEKKIKDIETQINEIENN